MYFISEIRTAASTSVVSRIERFITEQIRTDREFFNERNYFLDSFNL